MYNYLEDRKEGEGDLCGRLNFSMYGTRDAAKNWANAYSQQLIDAGSEQAKASPCMFYNRDRSIRAYVHCDDYVSTGKPEQFKCLKEQLEKAFQVKTRLLGLDENHMRQVKILNRIITWHDNTGISYEVDPRHVELV